MILNSKKKTLSYFKSQERYNPFTRDKKTFHRIDSWIGISIKAIGLSSLRDATTTTIATKSWKNPIFNLFDWIALFTFTLSKYSYASLFAKLSFVENCNLWIPSNQKLPVRPCVCRKFLAFRLSRYFNIVRLSTVETSPV